MLTYSLENTENYPMYEYLYRRIRADILSGKIKSGERLPSKRTFADNLGVSVITVEGAYDMLRAEGYIFSVPKKGFYVNSFANIPGAPEKKDMPGMQAAPKSETGANRPGAQTDLENKAGAYRPAGAESKTVQGTPAGPKSKSSLIADFTRDGTDPGIFPFSIWVKAMRRVVHEKKNDLMKKPPCGGIDELKCAISKYLSDFRGMRVNPAQIVIGAGTEYLYSLLIQIVGRTMTYGIEDPGYHKSAKIYKELGVPFKYVGMDGSGVKPCELEKKNINVIHVSPSHHFPTGIVMPVNRRYELLEWVRAGKDRYVIEDDYDSELRMSGRPLPTLASIDSSDRVIYMNTFTKTLCSTVRVSYMVLPDALARRFYGELSFYSCTVSNFEQYTLASFIEDGSFEKHINRLRRYYQKKRDDFIRILNCHPLGERILIREKEAGVHFIMEIKTKRREEDVIATAAKEGVILNPVSAYCQDGTAHTQNAYVMNYSALDLKNAQACADAIFKAAF